MRWLVNYFRQVFCKHEFKKEESFVDTEVRKGIKISLYCPKCGYHKSFWKFL